MGELKGGVRVFLVLRPHSVSHTHGLTLSDVDIHTHSPFFSLVQPMGRAFGARFLITHGNSDFGHVEEG